MCRVVLLFLLMLLAGCVAAPAVTALPPDAKVFDAVVAAFMEEERSSPNRYAVQIEASRGVVLADWHPEHKGEFEIKVEARVTGSTYEVQAWQRGPGDLFMRARETEWSRRAEDRVLKRIAAGLASR